jgi:hypothetical protein
MGSVSGGKRQKVGEDVGLFAVGQIGHDEATLGERRKGEDVDAGRNVGNEGSFVGIEISGAHGEAKRAKGINHVAAASAWLKDRALDCDRATERWDDPVYIEGKVPFAFDALKTGRRNVAVTAAA